MKEIINGITNTIIKKDDIEAVAKNRLEICSTCDKRETIAGVYKCGMCGCILNFLVRSGKKCKLNKWQSND